MIKIEVFDKQHNDQGAGEWSLRNNSEFLSEETEKKMLNRFSKRPKKKPKRPKGEVIKEHEHPNKDSWWDKIKSWLSLD